MTPELMIKACTFYTGHIVTRIQQIFCCHRLTIILKKWREKAIYKNQKKEDEMLLKHELELQKWKDKLKLKVASKDASISPELSFSEVCFVGETREFDISLLPDRAISQVCMNPKLAKQLKIEKISRAWWRMPVVPATWEAEIDFSTVKNMITDKHVVSTLQRWRLNVLRLNFRGCLFRPKTFRSVSHCKNLQELNVSNCSTLTDESMRHISEGCPGVLFLNLSNTNITNRTMRLLPRHFHNLQNLSLAYCRKFTDKGLQYLNLGNGCHKLIYLDLSGCTQITDSAIEMLSAKCCYLHILDISGCVLLTDQSLEGLQIGCKQLRILKMLYCGHISKEAAHRMSSVVQQQEYSSNDPPRWFGYDCEGNPLTENQDRTPSKEVLELTLKESLLSSEEEEV
uniref:F-box and leucine rich repeat protein 13 n=1 Tax=Propithecus coquereli TaxID=379532 RepID=A0A2K6ETY4_PROCO